MNHRRFAPLPLLLVAFALLGGLLIPTLDALAATKTTKKATTKKAAPKTKFSLALDTAVVTVPRGSGATATVLLTRNGTFAAPVSLSATARRGLAFTFDDNPLSGDDTDVTVSAASTATLGSTTITVTGKSGSTAVKLLVKVTVVPALPAGVTTTTAVPLVAAPTIAVTTTVPPVALTTTAPAATTTTTPATTTTQPATTTTTTLAATTTTIVGPTTTVAAPGTGVLIVARRISQGLRCASAPAGAQVVAQTLVANSGTSARVLTAIFPGTCTEVAFTPPLVLQPGANPGPGTFPIGTLLIARATDVPGSSPVRAVSLVTVAVNPATGARTVQTFDAAGTMMVSARCFIGGAPVALGDPNGFTLADGEQRVFTNIAPGLSCSASGPLRPFAIRSNAGAGAIPPLAAGCPPPTPSTPLPGLPGCYAEITVED